MHIQQETSENHAIRSYTNESITIGNTLYQNSIIISKQTLVTDWTVQDLNELTEEALAPIIKFVPEVIIIGHQGLINTIPISVVEYLSKKRIGVECMQIGAACRTYNVLINEQRKVIAAFILKHTS
jgi:uncharacterized protein